MARRKERQHTTQRSKNSILRYIKPRVQRLVYLKKLLDDLEEVEVYGDDAFNDIINPVRFQKEFHKRAYEFYNLLDTLEAQGIIVQDLEEGIVDIPITHQGKNIILSWSLLDDQGRNKNV